MAVKNVGIWSKSLIHKPKNNFKSHILINKVPFKASYEKEPIEPPSTTLLLAWEYGRIYQKERCEYAAREYSNSNETKKEARANASIVRRFYQWLEKYKSNKDKPKKKYCCNIVGTNK